MKKRLVLGAVTLVLLVLSSGCLGAIRGPQDISNSKLDESPVVDGYAWGSDRNAHITVTDGGKFAAVYDLNKTEVELFRRDGLGGRNAIPVSALRYRYENGTVIDGSTLKARGGTVKQTREAVTVTLPKSVENGRSNAGELAFTSSATPKRFTLPTFVKGSYEVVLPPNRRVDFFLFGQVQPQFDERTIDDQGRTHLRWSSVQTDSILVQFYLQRDLTVFGGIVAALVLVAVGGLFYYQRQIEALEAQREEMGLGVNADDDDDRRRPPGGR